LSFSGSKDEWPTWGEKFLAKAKRSGINDVLLGKVLIPKSSEVFDEKTDEGKRILRIIDLNEMAFIKLVWKEIKQQYSMMRMLLLNYCLAVIMDNAG
jgi:hypothetical protein